MAIKGARADLGSVTPHLMVRGGDAAIDFYRRAFGALLLYRVEITHPSCIQAHLRVGHSMIMVADEATDEPADGLGSPRSPEALGATTVTLGQYVEGVDASYARAIEAGATSVMEPSDAPNGDRCAAIQDPFGHRWTIMTMIEELTGEQVAGRMRDIAAHGNRAG
ncbi:MAG: VOC family protein [Gemmatimonadaceae bacterium]